MRISRRQEARWQKDGRKGPEVRCSRSRLHGYFGFVNGETLFLFEKSDVFSSPAIRDGERNRTKETSPIGPQRLPYHISSASSPSLSLLFNHPSCCPRPLLRRSRGLTQPLHQDPLDVPDDAWTAFPVHLASNLPRRRLQLQSSCLSCSFFQRRQPSSVSTQLEIHPQPWSGWFSWSQSVIWRNVLSSDSNY